MDIQFFADKEFMDKLERVAELGGVLRGDRNLVELLEEALEVFLEENDPQRRQQDKDSPAGLSSMDPRDGRPP